MAYLDFSTPVEVRMPRLVDAINNATCIGMQLVWLFELFMCVLSLRQDFKETYGKLLPRNTSGSVQLNDMDRYWPIVGLAIGAVHTLESFRNTYVHNGPQAAVKYYTTLLSDRFVFDLIQIAMLSKVQLDFALPL